MSDAIAPSIKAALNAGGTDRRVEKRECQVHGLVEHSVYVLKNGDAEVASHCLSCDADKKRAAQELQEEEARKAEKAKRAEAIKKFKDCGLGARFIGAEISSYEVADGNKSQARVKSIIERFCSNVDKAMTGNNGIMMLGYPGTGKTMLAACCLRAAAVAGYSVHYSTAIDIVRRIRESWRRDAEKTERQIIKEFVGYDLLVIDELGNQHGTESETLSLYDVINGRYADMKPTIVVSNMDHGELESALGKPTMRRLKEGAVTMIFDWEPHLK